MGRITARKVQWVFAALLAVGSIGCNRASSLTLTSYRDPYFPESYELHPDTCVYRKDRSGDYHVLAHSVHAAEGESTQPVEQWMHVHVYWRPRPGKTVDDPSSLDATLTYVVSSGDTKSSYSGSAFAYPDKARYSDDLILSIEGARMTPASAPPTGELLGATRVVGKVRAQSDATRSVDLQRQMQLMMAAMSDGQ